MAREYNSDDFLIRTKQDAQEANKYLISIDEDLSDASNYRDVFEIIREAQECDVVEIILNTTGGDVFTMIQFVEELKTCKATTRAIIYRAFSAGAMIALACDEVITCTLSCMMIHTISWGVDGKTQEMKDQACFIHAMNKLLDDKLLAGFLTDEELKQLEFGKDFWFLSDDIIKRFKKRNEYLNDVISKIQKKTRKKSNEKKSNL